MKFKRSIESWESGDDKASLAPLASEVLPARAGGSRGRALVFAWGLVAGIVASVPLTAWTLRTNRWPALAALVKPAGASSPPACVPSEPIHAALEEVLPPACAPGAVAEAVASPAPIVAHPHRRVRRYKKRHKDAEERAEGVAPGAASTTPSEPPPSVEEQAEKELSNAL